MDWLIALPGLLTGAFLLWLASRDDRKQKKVDAVINAAVENAGKAYRDGGYRSYGPADASDGRTTFGHRVARKPVSFTARELEHFNAHRKLRGTQPLTLQGYRRAIRVAPTHVTDSNDWATYFMVYEAMAPHEYGRVLVDSGITVTPGSTEPGGGAYGGAGAPGGWDNPETGPSSGGGASATAGPDPAPCELDTSSSSSYDGGSSSSDSALDTSSSSSYDGGSSGSDSGSSSSSDGGGSSGGGDGS